MAIISGQANVEIPDDIRSFPRLMLQKFEDYGDKQAIVDSKSHRSYTFKQLHGMIKKCGSALLRRGFKPKDVLAVILPNLPEYPVVVYGATAVGATVTTISPSYTVDEFTYQLKDSGASYIITTPQLCDKVKAATSKLRIKNVFVFGEAEGLESFSSLLLSDDGSLFKFYEPNNWKDEVVYLLYSSGTTGLPKGVMLTHYNMIAHTLIAAPRSKTMEEIVEKPVMLGLLPMYHSAGLSIILGNGLYYGYQIVCIMGFEPEGFLKAVQDFKISSLAIVPPIAIFLAKHPMVCKFDLTCVHSIFCGAAPLGEDIMEQLKLRFPHVEVIGQGYGLTETAPAVMATPADNVKLGSVGVLHPNLQAKVIDLKTGVLLGPGQDGEICIRGPTVMRGYHNKPEATANTIDKDGWLHTGDVGHYDEDEHFFIVDRIKELIKYKGFQVSPAQLEDILLSHPQITDAAVIGVPDPQAGELPKAFVVSRVNMTEKEVSDFVNQNVAPHKKLRGGVEFVESIPKNPSGKIMHRRLREQHMMKSKKKVLKHKL